MATTIKQRTIGGLQENAIQLNNSQFGRSITLPSNWSKIRVGVRFHFTDSGGDIGATPRFALGFGHGTTNMIGDASCDHFVGVIFNDPTLSRFAGYYIVGGINGCKKVGVTLTLTGVKINSADLRIANDAAGAGTDRQLFFSDITKGSPNYTFHSFYPTNIGTDTSDISFLNQIEATTPVLTNHQYVVAPQTLAVDESVDGVLNAIQCWWDQADPVCEAVDLAWAVIA